MNIHLCGKLSRDEACRRYGVPRLHINHIFSFGGTYNGRKSGWCITIALSPRGKSQSWNPRVGYTDKWRWITISPPRHKMCCYDDGPRGCGRLTQHKGDHAISPWSKRSNEENNVDTRTTRTQKLSDTDNT